MSSQTRYSDGSGYLDPQEEAIATQVEARQADPFFDGAEDVLPYLFGANSPILPLPLCRKASGRKKDLMARALDSFKMHMTDLACACETPETVNTTTKQ